jgi:hypothetical protein
MVRKRLDPCHTSYAASGSLGEHAHDQYAYDVSNRIVMAQGGTVPRHKPRLLRQILSVGPRETIGDGEQHREIHRIPAEGVLKFTSIDWALRSAMPTGSPLALKTADSATVPKTAGSKLTMMCPLAIKGVSQRKS